MKKATRTWVDYGVKAKDMLDWCVDECRYGRFETITRARKAYWPHDVRKFRVTITVEEVER